MIRNALLILWFLATFVSSSFAGQSVIGATSVIFASVKQGREILTKKDDFVQRMSPFDRSARLKTKEPVSESAYLGFVGSSILEWKEAETQKIKSVLETIRPKLEALDLPLPRQVFFVKTTGKEEGGAAYTRANAIVLPERDLVKPAAKIQNIICHELFHIISRANPGLRDELYGVIGFVKCNEIQFPPVLKPQKITNPDAPMNDHYIGVKVRGRMSLVVPILFSRVKQYDEALGGEFFNYLQLQFLVVEKAAESPVVTPLSKDNRPVFVDLGQQSGFFEQVGRNTRYIIHPEEILADNFALLVLNRLNAPSPEVVAKIGRLLKKNRTAGPGPSVQKTNPRP